MPCASVPSCRPSRSALARNPTLVGRGDRRTVVEGRSNPPFLLSSIRVKSKFATSVKITMMSSLSEIIAQLQSIPSTKEKLAILQSHKDNLELRNFLWATYEPTVNYYMTTKVLGTLPAACHREQPALVFNSTFIKTVLQTIAARKLTGANAKEWVLNALSSMSAEDAVLFLMMIARDVRAGISTSTINKVWPELITDPPYMRMSLPKETDIQAYNWGIGVFSQRKADGMFCYIDHRLDGIVSIRTRAGRPFPNDQLTSLIEEIKLVVPVGQQAHGELNVWKIDHDENILLPREISNGIFNSLLSGGELPANHLVMVSMWDMLPIAEALPKGKFPVTYRTRWGILEIKYTDALLDSGLSTLSHVSLIETQVVHSLAEAMAHYSRIIEEGGEGTIIKDPDGIWEDTTSKACCKLKLEFEVDLKVTGFNAGKGKNAKTFGSLICESSCGQFKVNVSGFKDAQRQWIWENHETILNTIVAVRGNSLMSPRVGKPHWSMFLPRFVESRAAEKSEADSLERIQAIFANALKNA